MSRPRVSPELRARVEAKSRYRCGYCLTAQQVSGIALQLDHLQPYSEQGPTEEFNLWLACVDCNNARSNRTVALDAESGQTIPLFNPRDDQWREHFLWEEGGRLIVGLSPTGRATVAALELNRANLVHARAIWILAGWHPPRD